MENHNFTAKKIWLNYILANKWAVLILIGNFIIIVASLAEPLLLGKLIDKGLVDNNLDQFFNFLFYLVICYIIGKATSYFVNIGLVKLHYKVGFDINLDIVKHVQNLPISFFYKKDIIYLSSRINDDSQNIINFLLEDFLEIIVNLIISILILFLVYLEMPIVSLLSIPFLCLYVFVYIIINQKLFSQSFKQKEEQNTFFSKLNGLLTNIKFIKCNCIEDLLVYNIKTEFQKLLEAVINYTKTSWLFSFSCDIIKYFSILLYIYYFGTKFKTGNFTIGLFIVILNYLTMLFDSINSILNSLKEWKNAEVAFSRCNELLSLSVETNGTILIKEIDHIDLNNITFGYDNRLLFEKFSFRFSKNHIYCIVGENGKGKTSLISIIMGILKPLDGAVLFNDINAQSIDMKELRLNKIAYSDQEPILLNTTIRNNLFLKIDSSEEIPANYIDYLNLKKENSADCTWLDYIYDDQTHSLSGGEKQKISQMRCFLKNSDILIFDEPTAALDSESKFLFFYLLNQIKCDRIIITISHDADLIGIADRIINL